MPYRPKHQIEVAWTQSKKRWKYQAVQPRGDQTYHDGHDLPIVVARFGRIESPHFSVLQIAENYRSPPCFESTVFSFVPGTKIQKNRKPCRCYKLSVQGIQFRVVPVLEGVFRA